MTRATPARPISRRRFLELSGGLLGYAALAGGSAALPARNARMPNLVFILADDLGWRDTSLYGSTFYETPNIDRLAKRGMVFSNAYAANPLCSPTRASIMTGLYPARIGITAPVCHLPDEKLQESVRERGPANQKLLVCDSATRLSLDYYALAEALRDAGYRTGHFGKWHLGPDPYDPLHQGFDVDLPHWPGPGPAGGYLGPWKFPSFKGEPGEHIEDRMGQEAVRFIQESRDRPFFVNYWQFSVHAPYIVNGQLQAKEKLIEKYRAKADPTSAQRNPVYAAMVETLDANVGRILDTLHELGLSDNTIVIFFSDNGGVHFTDIEGTPVTSNLPLRGGKATIYEGGTREDCIVVWPGQVKPGSRSDAIIQSVDFYPTILDMLSLKPRASQRFDGISITPALRQTGRLPREAIFCYFPHVTPATGAIPSAYARKGDWKLIRFLYDGPDFAHRYELYNLQDDIGETNNLADRMPRRVKELDALIEGFLTDTHAVLPKPNPAYQPNLAGWEPSRDAQVSVKNGILTMESTGGDPFMFNRDVPRVAGETILGLRLRSSASGPAQVFWGVQGVTPLFARERSLGVKVVHDGEWHTYSQPLPEQPGLTAVRIDPATAPGRIEFDWIRLTGTDGTVLKEWTFGAP